jgi:glucose-1-phosphate cytidylyltransferase
VPQAKYVKQGMKVVILAGGLGSRISEESGLKPKPMIEIGGKPILWHIMKIYSTHGINDFVVCCGYKGYLVKEYFSNYLLHMSDVTFDVVKNKVEIHDHRAEPWRVTLVDTGSETMTGGRIKRVQKYIGDETFCMTYGDGVADINIQSLLSFHREEKRLATITAVRPPGRFGALRLSGKHVTHFEEKPSGDGGYINGGFFVLSPKVFDFIDGDTTIWEQAPLSRLTSEEQLFAYKHDGFWQPMDTLRDKNHLEELWMSGKAPWKIW